MKFFNHLKIVLSLIIISNFLVLALPLAIVRAQTAVNNVSGVMGNLTEIAGPNGADLPQYPNLSQRVGTYINYLLRGLGALFLGLAIFAGAQWMLARDNEENIKKSQDLLRDAAVGLAIVLAAFLFTKFILDNVFKAITSSPAAQTSTSQSDFGSVTLEAPRCFVDSPEDGPSYFFEGFCRETCLPNEDSILGFDKACKANLKCCILQTDLDRAAEIGEDFDNNQ